MTSVGRILGVLSKCSTNFVLSTRNIARIPHWERHIRFDPKVGRKRPCQDVLDRFKRLNNGMWIRAQAGRHKHAYMKDDVFAETHEDLVTCTREECAMLDRMVTPFWLRRAHYVDDPYAPYHTRHGLHNAPRVDDNKRLVRERRKILLEDCVADRFFMDR